jgi:NDP-sugar pyrophosphorylase family protein
MKSMIFAAGLGTRLKPITDSIPKALVEVNGKTLLEININNLVSYGFNEIIINVHHFADKVIEYLESRNNFGIRIEISDERDFLLNTGGGLKKAKWFFDDGLPFLVYNVDILSSINLEAMYKYHCEENSLATLAVRSRTTERYFLFDNDNLLCGWRNNKTNEERITRPLIQMKRQLAFSGVHVISPAIFSLMPGEKVFSMVDLYLNLSSSNKIVGFLHNESTWMDIGKPESLKSMV